MGEESDMFAPGWPGIPPRWTSSAKSGLGGVVDAVPEVADRVAGALERAHDALFLLRIDLGKE